MRGLYTALMDSSVNPLRNLPKVQRFQVMVYLSMMWTAIFRAGAGAWVWYGELVVAHVLFYVFIRSRRFSHSVVLDLGLVYEVDVDEGAVHVRMTLTSPGCPAAAIQLADSLTSPKPCNGAPAMLVSASPTAMRPEAGASSTASGDRSPTAIASPVNPSCPLSVTAQSATGTCHGPTI